MARFTRTQVAEATLDREELLTTLETAEVLRVVTIEQVEDELNDQFGEPLDDGYLAWREYCRAVEEGDFPLANRLEAEWDPYYDRNLKLSDPLQ